MIPPENRSFFRVRRQNENSNESTETGLRQRIRLIREFFRVQYVDCNNKVAVILIAIIGLLTSMWADCILVVTCVQDYSTNGLVEFYIDKTIIQTSQLTHFILVLTCSAGLIYGVKIKNKSFLMPWIFMKIMELAGIVLGIIILSSGHQRYLGVVPVGICFSVIGLYTTLCVYDTYSNTAEIVGPQLREVYVDPTPIFPDSPPSYDSYIAQSHSLPIPSPR